MSSGKHADILNHLYSEISNDIIEVIEDPDISDFITILEVICKISGMVEVLKVGEKNLKGKEKKQIVLLFGRFLIDKHCSEDLRESVIDIYDSVSDHMTETIISFAKNNKVISKSASCFKSCL